MVAAAAMLAYKARGRAARARSEGRHMDVTSVYAANSVSGAVMTRSKL
jgi:hypothetical protein